MKSRKQFLELISEFSKVSRDKVNMQKSIVANQWKITFLNGFIYCNNKEPEIFRDKYNKS